MVGELHGNMDSLLTTSAKREVLALSLQPLLRKVYVLCQQLHFHLVPSLTVFYSCARLSYLSNCPLHRGCYLALYIPLPKPWYSFFLRSHVCVNVLIFNFPYFLIPCERGILTNVISALVCKRKQFTSPIDAHV